LAGSAGHTGPTGTVVDVVLEVVVKLVLVELVVVVPPAQGQFSTTFWPVAFLRQISASVALVGSVPLGAHTQASAPHGRMFTATCKMTRQSVAEGIEPFDTGWLQSPNAAGAGVGARMSKAASTAAAQAAEEIVAFMGFGRLLDVTGSWWCARTISDRLIRTVRRRARPLEPAYLSVTR